MTNHPKITLLSENLYIIRCIHTFVDGSTSTLYYMTPAMWTKAPTRATIFCDYDAGTAHMNMYHKRDRSPRGWADGRTEILDVVPLYGEIITSPNATVVEVKKNRK